MLGSQNYKCQHPRVFIILLIWFSCTGKPSFVDIVSTKTILEKAALNITCTSISLPAASIRWEKNGSMLADTNGVSIKTSVDGKITRSSVEISSASYLHNGTYSCIAFNKYGSGMQKTAIQVYGKIKLLYILFKNFCSLLFYKYFYHYFIY